MNRNFRHAKLNPSKRGKAPINGPAVNSGNNSMAAGHKPLHSSVHGQQDLDENPFSHLALEIEMDRPCNASANPFDKGVMPSFDDRAIDEDYRNETAKKFANNRMETKQMRTTRQTAKASTIPPPTATRQPAKAPTIPPLMALDDLVAPLPVKKDVKIAATLSVQPVREPAIVKKIIPDVHDELDLDDIPPKQPVVMPSIDLKPQINIRSRGAVVSKEDVKPRFNALSNREPVVTKPLIHSPVAPTTAKSIPPVMKPVPVPLPVVRPQVPQTKPFVQSTPAKPLVPNIAPAKPIIDYFGTQSNESKADIDPKEEYFRESQIEANLQLFGVREPTRPLTNVEVSKRKKLILKLVDQKLKMKLNELMSQLIAKPESTGSRNAVGESGDSFADQMENLVPDSIPDNVNTEQTQNWAAHPSTGSESTWNLQPEQPNNPVASPWPIRAPMFQQQQNSIWMQPPMNPYPPGVDRFPGMQPMRHPWHGNPWQPHMRPPETHWGQQPNWNIVGQQQINPHILQPNVVPFPVPPVTQTRAEKPAAEIELELKEKEFLERTLMGTKRRDVDSSGRNSSERLRRRSRHREHSRDRGERRRSRERSTENRSRGRSRHESRSSSHRSTERILHRNVVSPSELSPLIDARSLSGDNFRELLYDDSQFEPPMTDLMAPYKSRSRSRDSREDLRVRLSQRRNAHRSRSPADLRNKLSDNRQNRDDDLRNQLAERSKRKRSRSSRSHSRGRSSKRVAKSDDDSEWLKFNNIVGMLMNIDRDAELTTDEMVERKEIMRLLLENPDLLELDDKYVYKFGKGRLNLAVKEAENILYPNGVPDERIASLISKKIGELPTEKKIGVEKDTVPIQWIKLCNIIDQVLHLTLDERKKLKESDKRMIERDELLIKISDDPNDLLKLGTKYGHRNVEWASKFARKILYYDGVRDKRVDQTIAKERKKAMDRIEMMKKSNESHKAGKSSDSDGKTSSKEWNELSALITNLFQIKLGKSEKMSREDDRRRDELLVQMSRYPNAIKSNTKFTDKIDKTELNDTIEKCKGIIASVKANSDKSVLTDFERQRTKLLETVNYRAQRDTAHDQIIFRLSGFFEKTNNEKWSADEKIERDALTEALIKDPESIRTNKKALERIGDDKTTIDELIADVKQILTQLSKSKGPKKFHISSTKVIDIPFVVKIEDASGQLDDTTKTVLLKALRDMVSEIEHPPKPKILQQRYINRSVEVVCANLLTFEWLKRAIVSDFQDKWPGADLNVERVPVAMVIPRDKLKSVDVVFKDARATLPFDDIVRELRKENPKLYPERWELQDGRGVNGDYKKKIVGIDIESLAALEQMNRFARLGRSLVYFDISYMGDNVANFEATCQ